MDKIQPRMKTHYDTYVCAKLQEEFAFSNPHQIPRLEKIVLNVGIGEAAKDQKLLESTLESKTTSQADDGKQLADDSTLREESGSFFELSEPSGENERS